MKIDGNTIRMTDDEFRSHIIAQDDDDDYSESGYVVIRISNDLCFLSSYGHCSCYGTATSLRGGDYGDCKSDEFMVFQWRGTWAELVDMAKRTADPALPDRTADPEDYDYDHLVSVYSQILKQNENDDSAK